MAKLVRALITAIFCLLALPAQSQELPQVMVVFDGSNSMWGQIDGVAKIEIARKALSSVLSDADRNMTIGMIAYGHTRRGDCSDIETVVPAGPAMSAIPQIIAAANGLTPRGKTPLSDAVRMAAEDLRYTEDTATVILITDGIETCEADPCALGTELERFGIDFTAHVIGFGLTQDEGRQVSCLAENTGGLYVPAVNADDLVDALESTLVASEDDLVDIQPAVIPEPEPVEPEAPQPRNVTVTLRDVEGGEILTARQIQIAVEPQDGGTVKDFEVLHFDQSAAGRFLPGTYRLLVSRMDNGRTIRSSLDITVEAGDSDQHFDLVTGARLRVDPQIAAGESVAGKRVASAVAGEAQANFQLFPIEQGVVAQSPYEVGYLEFDYAVPPGAYLLRGTFARTVTRDRLVEVKAGQTLDLAFNFDLARVIVDARNGDGSPVDRQSVALRDSVEGRHWQTGSGGEDAQGVRKPFFLPPGIWHLQVDGRDFDTSHVVVRVPQGGQNLTLQVGPGQQLTPEEEALFAAPTYRGCLDVYGAMHDGCVVEQVQP